MQRVTLMDEQDGLQGRDCLALIAFFHISYYQPERVHIDTLRLFVIRFKHLRTLGPNDNVWLSFLQAKFHFDKSYLCKMSLLIGAFVESHHYLVALQPLYIVLRTN